MSERISVSEFARRDGCNEKLVRRAIERGRLVRGEDGKLEAQLVGTPWRRSAIDGQKPARPGAERAAAAPPSARAGAEDSAPDVALVPAGPGVLSTFANSAAREKAAMARMRELELEKREGKLVDVEAARGLVFDAFRTIRDHWLAFPSAHSARIAAKLDADPDLVSEVLIEFIRKHAAKITDPAFDLSGHRH